LEMGIEALPVPATPEDGVDLLALWEVIEHVDRPADFLRTCMQHVRPGGWLVLSTIARTWPSWFVTKLMAEDVFRIVPRGTHDWEKYLNANELARFFEGEKQWAVRDEDLRVEGCVFAPGLGWKFVNGGENWGNYFFGARRDLESKGNV
jgi:polyprenyldihydroxybenzoate methyltransferase/3-demethylubiquinol 3-O-methyltransferase